MSYTTFQRACATSVLRSLLSVPQFLKMRYLFVLARLVAHSGKNLVLVSGIHRELWAHTRQKSPFKKHEFKKMTLKPSLDKKM